MYSVRVFVKSEVTLYYDMLSQLLLKKETGKKRKEALLSRPNR